ncbi:protein AHNAK2 isoform X2 [Lonchura striata]
MEVTLKTEVEAGASGFSVKGGGNEGIFIKKVLKESPASKIFSLREGDQLLSATIFFDNIKYEDALKILQYSEPYRVQFSLKRKIAVQEDLEHSTAQHKKERIGQEKELSESIPEETLIVSGKAISEEDRQTLIVSQRVGRSKRPKKDRLSWPKFQSIKNKKILRHRRSHSTSDAYEPAVQDISPTSTDTESQFPQEVHTKEKKASQRKLKFPSIGFRMHRSRPEPQEKQKKEIKTTLISEKEKIHKDDISLENPEILTVEYTTSPAYEMKTGEGHEALTKDLKEMKNGIASHVKQCPEVEISIEKEKDKEATSKFSVPEVPDITEIPKPSLEAADLKVSPTKKSPQASSKSRKKKQKGAADKRDGESGINIDLIGHNTKGYVQVKGLEIGAAKAELQTSDTLGTGEKRAEDTQILSIQKINYEISVPPKKETETDTTKQGSDVPHSVPKKPADTTLEDSRNLNVKTLMPDAESNVSTSKLQMPSFKVAKAPKTDMKITREESREDKEDSVKKEWIEDKGMPTNEKALNIEIGMKKGEKDTEEKESKFRLPKLKFPTFTWSITKDETAQPEAQISEREVKVQTLENAGGLQVSEPPGEIRVPSAEMHIGIPIGTKDEHKIKQNREGQLPSPKDPTIKSLQIKINTEDKKEKIQTSNTDIPIQTKDLNTKTKYEISEITTSEIKAPRVDISLPSVDVTLPQASVDMQAPEATLSLEEEAKGPEKEVGKAKDGKFKMPKFGMPTFGWSSSKEAKGTVAAEMDVSLQEPQVTVPSVPTKVEVTLPSADIQAPSVEVTIESATVAAEGEKDRFKMPDVKMPSVKLPKVKTPQAQVSLPKAEVSLPKGQEGEVTLQGPEAKASLEVSTDKAEGGGKKIHMPKVKVPSVVFSKPSVKSPKLDADDSLPQAELKEPDANITITAPDITLPSVEGSLEIQAPDIDLKAPSAEGKLELEGSGLKGKLKMPKFDQPKFTVSSPKAEGPTVEVSLPSGEVDLPSTTVTATVEGSSLELEKPSLRMPKDDIKAPKVDISLPSVDVTLPQASVDMQAPEANLCLEGEAKDPKKEVSKAKDGKFKMPKFGMPSFGWSSSREAKGTVATEVDISLQEPQVTVPSGPTKVEVTLPSADIQAPSVEVTIESATVAAEGEKGRFKMPDVKMPSVKLPKVKTPQAQVSLPKAEVSLPKGQEGEVALQGPEAEASLEVAEGKAEDGGMKIHMPKVKVPSVVFSKPSVKSPKMDADISLPQVELKAPDTNITITAPDITLPSVEGSLEIQAPDIDLKAPSAEGKLELEGSGLKGKLKMPKFDKPKFTAPSPKAQVPTAKVSLPSAEVDLPSTTVTATVEGSSLELEKPSLKMPKADIQAPKVDVSLPSVDITLPQANVDLQVPKAALSLEGEAKGPEKEVGKAKDGKFKMPKLGMPSFGWSSRREAKGTVATDVDISFQESQVMVPSGPTEVEGTLPTADIQAPSVEVTIESATVAAEGEKDRFKMPDVKMPSVKLPKVKTPQAQVSLPKAEVSLPKGQEGEVTLQGPEAKASLEVSTDKAEGGGMKIHMPKVKVPSVVFSKPSVKSPKLDADDSLPQAELKEPDADITITAPDITLPSVEGSLEIQAPDIDLKAPSAEGKLELEGSGLKGKLKMPKFDKPKFTVSSPKAEGPTVKVSLPSGEVDLPSTTVTATVEGSSLELEKPSLRMPKDDIKAPKVDISLPSVDVTLPQASVDMQAPEANLCLEGEAKDPKKEVGKAKDGKFKMPKFGMPSFGWSSSREAKGTVATEVDISLQESQVTVPSGPTKVEVTLPTADIQAPSVEVTIESATVVAEGEKDRFNMPDVKMPSVKLPKVKAPQAQVSLPKAELSLPKGQEGEVTLQGPESKASLEVSTDKAEGGGMKIHMPKVKVPSVVFSKPSVKSPKLDADDSLPEGELKASDADITITAPDITLPYVEGSLEIQAPDIDLKAPSGEGKLELEGSGLKGKLKMPKFDKPKFTASSPKTQVPTAKVSLPSTEVDLHSPTVTGIVERSGLNLETPSLRMPKADIKAPKEEISLPSVDGTLPQANVDLQLPEATLSLEGEAKGPPTEVSKVKDGKFKMPKFGMPSFGWSSSREAKGTVAAEVDASLQEPQVTVPSGSTEVEVTLPAADIQAPNMEVTIESANIEAEGEKGRFKMPDVKMPSVKLPKIKAPQTQVSLPKAEVSLPKGQEGEIALQGPEAKASLEVSTHKDEGSGMNILMPKVKVPSVVFAKPSMKSPKLDAGVSLLPAELKAPDTDITAPDITLPSVEGSLEIQAPDIDLKAPSAEGKLELEGSGLKGKLKLPKFDKPKFIASLPKAEGPTVEVSLPSGEVDLPSSTVTATGDGSGLKLDKPFLKMPKADIKAPKVDISLPSVDIALPQASVNMQAPETTRFLEGEAKGPEKEVSKVKDGKFKMPKFGMPSFGWSSSREAKGTVAAEMDVSLQEPQVTVPSGPTKVEVTLPSDEIQAPSVEVTIEPARVVAGGEKDRFKMPDVKMPSVNLPKVKTPQAQVSLPKAKVSLPKGQEGEIALQGPEAKASLEVSTDKAEGGRMKIHMPKVKVPSVVFSKPSVKSPKLDADDSLPQAELKAPDADITATDITLPSVEGSLEIQIPDINLKAPSAEGKLELEGSGLKGKLKMPKFDKPKFTASSPKTQVPTAKVSLPSTEVDLHSPTVTGIVEGSGLNLETPSLRMPKDNIKAPKEEISLPSVDVTLPQANVDLQLPEATLSLEGEAKGPPTEISKVKDGKFKMPKFGMPSFGWSSSREAKGTVAAEVDASLQEPQVTVPSGSTEVEVTLPAADIQAPNMEVTIESAYIEAEGEKGRFKMPDVKMPSVKLPKIKAPQTQVSLPKAEVSLPKGQEGEVALQCPEAEASLEVAAGKAESSRMEIHMPKVKVPSVVLSNPSVKSPKLDAGVSLPPAELKAPDTNITAPDITLPSVEGSPEIQAPDIDLKAPSAEGKLELEGSGLKGKLKMPKFDKPKFTVSSPKAEGPTVEVSLPSGEVDLPSSTVTATGDGSSLKLEKPFLKMPKADIKAPKVDISLPSVDITLPQASVDMNATKATLSLEGEAKGPEKEVGKSKDGKFKMPKFGMPSFGWSSSREAKGAVAAEMDSSLQEPQVTVPSGPTKVEVTLPSADIQAPSVEVTIKSATVAAEGEKGRFKMPDVKMPSVKLPKVKTPQAHVSLPKAEESLTKGQEGEVALQGLEAKASLEVSVGQAAGSSMKIHMPKVKVPSVVFSKPSVTSPKLDADDSLPEAELKAADADITITAPDITLPSVEGSLEIQAPDIDLKAPSAEGKLELEGSGLKGKLKTPKFDKPKFTVSSQKAHVPAVEVTLLSTEVDLPSTTMTATVEGSALNLETPSLRMPKDNINAPTEDISLPSVDITLPQASVDLQVPEATLNLEGEAKGPEKEVSKAKDGKFKMPKFGMPSFGWSSSREAKGTVAPEMDVSLQEPQVTVPSGPTKVEVTLPSADIQAPSVEVTIEPATVAAGGEKDRFKMPDVKMPSVNLPKVKTPQAQVSLPEAEVSMHKGQEAEVALQGPEAKASLEVAAGKAEGNGMKIHMPKVKVPSMVFSKPSVKSPKMDVDVSLPQAGLKVPDADITITAPDITLPSVEGSLEIQATNIDLKAPSAEGKLELEGSGLKGKLKMPKFDKPKFTASSPKTQVPTAKVSLPSGEVNLPSPTLTSTVTSLPSVDITLPQASVDMQVPESAFSLEGEAKEPEKEVGKAKDSKFKMPKFGMPSFGWSSSREAKGTVATEVDASLQEPQVTVPSEPTEVEVTLPSADIQAPSVEVSIEPATVAAEGEKGRFKMPDVKMPSVKLPKVKTPQAQVSLPKAEVSLPKGQEGEFTLQGPKVETSLEVSAGQAEGSGMKIHMPKVKVPSVVFSKPSVKSPKLDADDSLPQAELKAADAAITAPDITLPSVEGSPVVQAPDIDLKAPSAEGKLELEGSGLKGKLKMPKFDKPKFTVSSPKAEGPTVEVSLPSGEVDLPSSTVTATGDGSSLKLEKPFLKMPKADIKAPKVDISLPSVDVTLPQASVDMQATKATLNLEGEAKDPKKEVGKAKDGKFKMPKFGMPSFGWSSSKGAKGTVAAEMDASFQESQVTVPSGPTEVEVTLPTADIQAPSVDVTIEPARVAAEGEKGRFKMPDVKMPSVKLPKVKTPQAQVSLPKAEVSLPKGQEGEVTLQGPKVEASLEVSTDKAEGGGMKIHMPKVKVPSVVFSKPTIKSPKLDADDSLPQAELKAADAAITAPDITLPSVEGSLEIQAPDIDLKAPSAEGKLELEGSGLKGKLKMPKFDKPKFTVSSPKAEGPTVEVSLPSGEVDLPSSTVTATGDGSGLKLEKPSLRIPETDIKAPKVDISLPSVDVTLPQASVDMQVPESAFSLEGEAKEPEKEVGKAKDGKFKMPKFGMPSFGWSSSREAKGTVAAEVDASLQEPQVTVPSGPTEVEVTLPSADIQAPSVEVSIEPATVAAEGEKGRFKMPDVKMPSVKLPKVKTPQAQVSLPKAEVSLPKGQEGEFTLQGPKVETSLEVSAGQAEGSGMKIHMPKVKVPSVVFSKPSVKSPKLDADDSLPQAELKAADAAITAPDITLPSVEGSPVVQAPDIDLKAPSAEGKLELEGSGLKGKLKMPKFDKPKFTVSSPRPEGPTVEVSLPSGEVDLPSTTVTATGDGSGLKLETPSLRMPKADIKAPKVDISLPSVDVTLPQASVDMQATKATLNLEGEAKDPKKEVGKAKDGKFKMPKFGMPSFGWSSSKEAKGTVAAEVDVSLQEPQVTVPSGPTKVEVTLPSADIQAPSVEVTVEPATVVAEGEKGRFKMPDVKMPSVKLPKVKAPQAQVSLPEAEVSLPKGQEGEVALQGPEAKASLEVSAGQAERSGMKIHMPKVKVPSVVFSKPSVTSPKMDADDSLPEAELKAADADITITAPDITLPSVEGSLEIQAPDIDLKAPSAEGKLELEGSGLKGKLKMPKFDKPKFTVSSQKAHVPAVEVTLPSTAVSLQSTTVMALGEGSGLKLEKPSLKMPKADIKAPKVDVSLPSVDITLPQASVDMQAPEATLSLEEEAKGPGKEAGKAKDGKFKMPKFGMPSFGWSSSREAKGTVAAEMDASLQEPQVTVSSGMADVDMTFSDSEIQAPRSDVSLDSSLFKEVEFSKSKTSVFRMPKISLSKSFKPHAQSQSGCDVSVSESPCYSLTEETSVPSESVEHKSFPDIKVESVSKSSKFRIPSIGFSKSDVTSSTIDLESSLQKGDITLTKYQINSTESESKRASLADENLSDFEILCEDGSEEQGSIKLEGKTTSAEVPLADTEVTVKFPKFRKPKFRIRSKGKASESDIGSSMESEISKGRITSDMTDPDIEKPAHISDAQLGVKLHKPSLEVVLDAPAMDPNLSSMEVTLPNFEAEIHGPDLECKAEQEVVTGEKDTEEKENKFKSSKFKLPSFRWSPKKEAIASSHAEEHLEGPTLSTLPGDMGSELTFPTPDNQYLHAEFDTTEKDGEKAKTKKSQFTMPKISFPKIKGQKVQVSLPVLETDVSGPKQEIEGVSVQKSEKGSSGEGAELGIKVPKVTVPTLGPEAKPEAKAPKIEMDISMSTGEVTVPTCEGDELTLKAAAAHVSLSTSDIKMIPEGSLEVKSPDISVEGTSSEIAVGDVEIKPEGSEGKTKLSKFQMPKVGIGLSKGKGSEKDVGQSKSEVKVPQLKATVEISDIAVEAPNLKVECGTEMGTYSPEAKITKTDSKTSEADVHLPSADIPIPKTDSDIQASDAAVKIKGEIKQDGDGEEKEGHFKMPKFKLPSFSWSPKKEVSVKSDSGANLEDQKLAVMSSRIDTEVKDTTIDDQGSGPDLDVEISAGKVEQKSPIKKPQFVMPKISLSKIKVPKSQSHSPRVEADATLPKSEIEGDDSIKIPDIEKSHPEGIKEGAQITIKLAETTVHTLDFSRVETEASETEITVSSGKIDASLTPSEGSFQQVDLKISSTNEGNIKEMGTKLPKVEASVDLKSPDMLTETSSVVDGRKMKLEGPEGKIKMPKFQKTKFGISRTKGKVPESEISSPKIETELPQLRTTNEIADIAVGVPASELTSDMSDPGIVDGKIKTPQTLTGGIDDAKVDIGTQSVPKPKTEGVTESLGEKEIKLKDHEIKAEEVQTEEHQGWFKMPKFRIPAFSRSSLKEKRSDADIERSMEKAQASTPSAKVQTEASVPENIFSLPHAVAEITIGKEGIQKLGDSVKSSNVSLPKIEGDISLSTERTDSRVSIQKTESYADVVKRSAEGHTSEITVSAAEFSKSYPSSESDKEKSTTNRFPTCTLTFPEHKGKSQDISVQKVESSMKLETSGVECKPSSAEITLDATQMKTDVSLPKEVLDSQNKEAAIKKGKIKGEVKIIGKDSEESKLKRTACEWSTTKGSEDGTYVTAKLEDLKVEVPTVKTDVKITGVDPEMKFQVKSVEKDVSAGVEVQVEDRAEISKIKAYKFKIPRFGMLHSEIKGFEDDTDLPKSEADSASKSENGTAEMQLQKPEGWIGLKSPDHIEASARITGGTVDQIQGVPEVSVRIPKLKIPRFTFRTPPIEADVLLSKVVTDPKGSSTDIEIVQLQASSAIPEETPGAVEGGVQKAKSKILTLTEPDIKTAQMTATIESSLSSAGQDIHWSYIEGQEVSEKVEPEHVAIERCEIYTTEILKESEILSSEVKTATLGFSLLKAKLPESHSDLDMLVQQPSPTGDASVRKPTGAGESLGVAAQRTELKLSDKPHCESEESRGKVSLSKLKTSAAEVKGSSKPEESFPDKSPEGITPAPLSEDEDVVEAVEGEEKDMTNEKEKTDSKRSPGRFKFWLPSIGFSSSGDEANTDAKAEIKKAVPEDVKPADTSDDSSKQGEKTGWFRLPKLGFTSPSKKSKSVLKEELGHKEGRLSDEDSPTDKPDVFFDAQESLSPKEIGEGEKAETDGASSIVTSSARTELILLEEDSKSNIVGDTTK